MKVVRKILLSFVSISLLIILTPFILILYFAEKEYDNTPPADEFDDD